MAPTVAPVGPEPEREKSNDPAVPAGPLHGILLFRWTVARSSVKESFPDAGWTC